MDRPIPTPIDRTGLTALCMFVLTVAALHSGCAENDEVKQVATAPTSPLIALTPTQFNNTVRDLLVLPADPSQWPSRPDIGVAPELSAGGGIFGSKAPTAPPWPYAFPPEAGIDGFEGMAKGQVPSSYAIEQLQKAARHYATFALVSPAFFTCDAEKWEASAEADRDTCAKDSLTRFALRAWRRPLTKAETERLTALWAATKLIGTPKQGLALAVSGILQAPSFIFRVERGDATRSAEAAKTAAGAKALPLSDWEMASRLSYYLWNTMPDPALFAAAAQGKLRTSADIEAQTRRMLDDPRAKAALVHFHHQWLGTNQLHRISPARRIYGPLFGIDPVPPLDTTGDGEWPGLMNPVRRSFELETELFVSKALFDKTVPHTGTLTALLTGDYGYVSKYSAPVYGVGTCDSVTYPGGKTGGKGTGCTIDPKMVDLDPDKATTGTARFVAAVSTQSTFDLHPATFPKGQRAGVLTLPSVLALGAHAVHPSPIKRGQRLLERVACVHFSPPPPTAEAAAPPDAPDDASTNRERTALATKPPGCAGCHEKQGMNAAGFAFEHYDSFGHWRAKDGAKAVDASGTLTLPGEPAITFKDGVDLANQLTKSPRVQGCYVQQHLRYAAGVEIPEDNPTLLTLQKRFRSNDNVVELLVAITGSDLFRYRTIATAAQGGK
ncbi:MAG: DUF1592 domain-containing protein [Myxococcales bacterium]|nr:DUF1592 domain-containing protein [Myxococcales bacterium]